MIVLALALMAATSPTPAAAPAAQALSACRRIAEDAARLACFDAAAARLDEAQDKGAVVIVDRQQVHELRRQAFGLNVPSVGALFHSMKGEDDTRLSARLASARQGPEGRWTMATEDGQEWRQTDDELVANMPHPGSELAVRRAALGSFFCKVDGQLAFRCERLR